MKLSIGMHVRITQPVELTPSSDDYETAHGPGESIPAGSTAAIVNTGPVATYLHGDEGFEGWLHHHEYDCSVVLEVIARQIHMPAGYLYRFLAFGNAPFDVFEGELATIGVRIEKVAAPGGGRLYRVPIAQIGQLPSDGHGPYLGTGEHGYSLYRLAGAGWWEDWGFSKPPRFEPL